MIRLNVNIDHIATLRQARKAFEPSVVAAAILADLAGASGITIHLRGDRRHIQDDDARVLRSVVKTHLNLEMAVTDEMIAIAAEITPTAVTLVPESPNEITTEGGLNVLAHEVEIKKATGALQHAGVLVSIFIDPVLEQVEASCRAGAQQIEICTARYADLTDPRHSPQSALVTEELFRLRAVARRAGELGMQVAAGHGLTYRNVRAVAAIEPVEELNIGHNIIARAALVGLERAVTEMLAAMNG
ncbi:MAG: pyridoxine 5'-phosphate synthase [Acidobacteria bacterium]|nr:pyridoxine 5'-phosphate synthase [Acidobacteriota bacterium]